MLTKHHSALQATLSTPRGALELMISEGEGGTSAPWAIICHPHPWYGGTMHNKVVTTLHKTFQALGAHTVRFNFLPIDHPLSPQAGSKLEHALTESGLADLLTVADWVSDTHAPKTIWLAGFSFGAYIATLGATHLSVEKLVTVAPPVTRFPMAALHPLVCQWILAQGEQDEVISAEAVFAWALKQNPQPTILRFPGVGHFFHGALQQLQSCVTEALIIPRQDLV
jgi:alpha/beta superfamily hydrolase